MRHVTVRLHLLLLLLLFFFLHPLTSVDPDEHGEKVLVEVIVESSSCSATCGLGVKTQTLCFMKDGMTAMVDDVKSGTEVPGKELSEDCRVRKVKCKETWQCGLSTMTVTSGQRVEIDCLGDIMKTMGRFSWRVSWRYARGIISSDDSLFTRWDAPLLDRVILDPIREEDAGTYRCVVQDATFRQVKKVFWGIRVLPVEVLNLDYESSLARWDEGSSGNQQNQTVSAQRGHWVSLLCTMLVVLSLVAVGAGLMLVPVLDGEDAGAQAV